MTSIATAFASDRAPCAQLPARRAPKEFDHVRAPRRPRLHVRRAEAGDIPELLRSAEAEIGAALASERAVTAIAAAHPDALWVFLRDGRIVGGFAMLMLDEAGLAALLADRIDLRQPSTALLARPGEAPAAIYVWAVLGRALAAEGIATVIERLQAPPYGSADIFALPASAHGLRLMRSLGFRPMPGHGRGLHVYVRLANRSHSREV